MSIRLLAWIRSTTVPAAVSTAVLVLAMNTPAGAQASNGSSGPPPLPSFPIPPSPSVPPAAPRLAQPPTAPPAAAQPPETQQQAGVDRMLQALRAAPDEGTASILEGQVLHSWLEAGTPAVTLLMSRGLRLLQAGQDADAIDSFSDAIVLSPDVAEAYHQRAIARYHSGDVTGAVRDLEETVKHEPRDFAAYHTLADIAAAREDWKAAYGAWRKVMELDPKTPNGEQRLKDLKRHAVGEDT